MGVTLCVRPGDGGTIVAISGEVDVCTEAPLITTVRLRRTLPRRRLGPVSY
jgi:hypothetical protein